MFNFTKSLKIQKKETLFEYDHMKYFYSTLEMILKNAQAAVAS